MKTWNFQGESVSLHPFPNKKSIMGMDTKPYTLATSEKERKRIDELMQMKQRNEKQHDIITKELRALVYKIEKGRV